MSYQHLDNATKIINHLEETVKTIRTARVNASILDNILVEAYGSNMHVNELATINMPMPMQLTITPFDKSVTEPIEKAVRESNLGVNPVNDGAGVILNFPPLSEEQREGKAKEVMSLLEDHKVQVRKDRTDTMKLWKRQKEDGEITEDDINRYEKQLQEEVNKANEELEKIAEDKKEELMKL